MSPHTLLLADDSVTIQRVIELTFADEDVRVVAVSDGNQAIAALDQSPPDIVLADVAMPGRNGYEVADYIKNTPRLAHIPVVLLSGAFEPIDQDQAAAVGCDAVLTKPFEPQLVVGRVKELLATPKQVKAPAENAVPDSDIAREWMATFDDQRFTEGVGSEGSDVDSYFDRLDRAFARLSSSSDDEVSRAGTDLLSDTETESPAAHLSGGQPIVRELSLPRDAPLLWSMPSLADAFAALLAAEQRSPGSTPSWPFSDRPTAVMTADLVEAVTERVLERLADRAVGERAGEVLTAVAERLVREEIERIKASIR